MIIFKRGNGIESITSQQIGGMARSCESVSINSYQSIDLTSSGFIRININSTISYEISVGGGFEKVKNMMDSIIRSESRDDKINQVLNGES